MTGDEQVLARVALLDRGVVTETGVPGGRCHEGGVLRVRRQQAAVSVFDADDAVRAAHRSVRRDLGESEAVGEVRDSCALARDSAAGFEEGDHCIPPRCLRVIERQVAADPEHVDAVEQRRVVSETRCTHVLQVREPETLQCHAVVLVAAVGDAQRLEGRAVLGEQPDACRCRELHAVFSCDSFCSCLRVAIVRDDDRTVVEGRHGNALVQQHVDRLVLGCTCGGELEVAGVCRSRACRQCCSDSLECDTVERCVLCGSDGEHVGAPQQCEAPCRHVVHVGHAVGDVRAICEQHVRHASQRLVHVDDVAACCVGRVARGDRRCRLRDLDAVRDQLVDETSRVGDRALLVVDGDHVGTWELGTVDVGLIPDLDPLVRDARIVGGVGICRDRVEGLACVPTAEDLDLVLQQSLRVAVEVLDRALDGDASDLVVDLGVARLVARAAVGQLDRVRHGTLVGQELRCEERWPVVPTGPDVAVGNLDLAGVLESRSAICTEVGVALDVGVDDGLFNCQSSRVCVRQEEVVLVVLTVRRATGLDLQHTGVSVEVDVERGLDDAGEVADDPSLGGDARDHVAVGVEAVSVCASSVHATVGVVRDGEVEAVVVEHLDDLRVI